MEAMAIHPLEELTETEFYNFINEGLEDMYNGRLFDFNTVFDELERRFCADE